MSLLVATCNTFNSSSDLYLIDWGRSSNCAANEPSNFSCASPPNIAGCPYCNDAFNECASLALPAAGCKPGATANVSSSSSKERDVTRVSFYTMLAADMFQVF